MWSVGATVVHMATGQPLNPLETITQLLINISQYRICINGKPLGEYLQSLNANDFKKQVISHTLCTESTRANWQQLSRILFPHSKRLQQMALCRESESRVVIRGMSYNSARDELFLADQENRVVRVIGVRRDNAGDLRDVYRVATGDTHPQSVCHMKDSDTLLVCEWHETNKDHWLVALRRSGSEWRETHRLQLQPDRMITYCRSAR